MKKIINYLISLNRMIEQEKLIEQQTEIITKQKQYIEDIELCQKCIEESVEELYPQIAIEVANFAYKKYKTYTINNQSFCPKRDYTIQDTQLDRDKTKLERIYKV